MPLDEHVQAAEQAAAEAERKADETEHQVLAGKLNPVQASADREAARSASLRAAVTRRRAERHRQAERLRELDAVGQDAVKHGAALQALRERVLKRQAQREELDAADASDIAE